LLPRGRENANCFEPLEATHNRSQPDRRPTADELQLYPERATLSCLSCQATARPRNRCHRACKQPKPARSKATPVTKDSHHSDRCPRRARHSQLGTAMSPVSKAPAVPLLRLFSADAWKAKIQRSARNLQAIPQGKQCAASIKAQNSAAIRPRRSITTTKRIISRMSTMFQIHIVGIGHIVMTSVRMVLTARGPCNTPS
jgi:hypothetical protein